MMYDNDRGGGLKDQDVIKEQPLVVIVVVAADVVLAVLAVANVVLEALLFCLSHFIYT